MESAGRLEHLLLEGFDDWVIEKGRAYYELGAVRELVLGRSVLTALVKGSRPHPYMVTMPMDRLSGLPLPEEADCSCPVGSSCKHVVAAALAFVARKAGSPASLSDAISREPRLAAPVPVRQEPIAELRRLLNRIGGPRATTVPLRSAGGVPFSGWVSEYLRPRAPPPERRDRWRLVFAVGVAMARPPGFQPGHVGEVLRPVLLPAVQYLSKSGGAGRVERYRPDRVTEPVDEASAALLSMVMGTGVHAPLLAHWDFLIAHPEVGLFAADAEGRPSGREPYAIRRIDRVVIDLRPTVDNRGAGVEVSLRPVVRLELEGDASSGEVRAASWVEAWEGRLIVATDTARLAWMDADPRYVELVRLFLEHPPLLSAAEAATLRQAWAADAPARIELGQPPRAVRLVSEAPTTRLLIAEDRWSRDLGVSVAFDYGREGPEEDGSWVLRPRDPVLERGVVKNLAELFGRSVNTRAITPWQGSQAAALLRLETTVEQFLAAFAGDLLALGMDLCLEDVRRRIERAGGPIHYIVESGIDWFGLKAEGLGEADLRSLASEDALFAAGLVRSGQTLLYIGKDEAEKLRRLLVLLDPDAPEPRVPARDMGALLTLDDIVVEKPPDLERLIAVARTLTAKRGPRTARLPSGLRATLRSYQRTGYSWLVFLAENGLNGCLADDMGLGKTVQALALLLRRKEAGAARPSLVVAPVSTLHNWRLEAARFAPALRVRVHHGQGRTRSAGDIGQDELVVVSYATLRMDAELLQAVEFDTVILDEAQSIKNPDSQSFAAVKGLTAAHRFTLTGTPLENSVVDLWSQFDFLEPGLLGSLSRFRKDYGATEPGPRVERLRRIIRPFILRRTKEVVEASLPPKEETTLYAEMGARQASAYQAIRRRYRLMVAAALKSKGVAGSGAVVFQGLLRLRQAACFPSHADPVYAGVPSCKIEVLRDLLEEVLAEGHRVLVFSQFVESLAEIRGELEARKTAYAYLDGSTTKRQEVIDGFQRPGGPPVFLLSLKAGGVGINLTAADYVVLFDPWWNPAVESQAVDRTHRIGQSRPVFVYRIVTRESIEEQILSLQERKRALVADLIDANPRSLLSLSEEEILGFFGDE